MQPRAAERIQLRPVAFGLLLLYCLALLLSALPDPVRPAFLVVPSKLAEAVLRRLAIRGGISVFEPPRERITDVLRNDCILVRGIAATGEASWLQPAGGRCVTEGFRPAIPDLEWMLRSLLTGGEGYQPPSVLEAAIGDFFCHAPPWRERRLAEVELVWTQPRFQIDTGAATTDLLLLFRWRCDPPGLISERLPPDEAGVRAFLERD
jgi:hypothetical protein